MRRNLASLAVLAALAGPAMAHAQAAPAAPAAPAAAPAAPSAAPAMMTIPAAGDLVATLKASGQFTILLKALDANALTSVVASINPLTVLAPTDAAFNALPPGALDKLLKPENASQLRTFLTNHLINAAVPPTKLAGLKFPIANFAGAQLQFDGTGAVPMINDAKVVGEGQASNGFIYAIDKVLAPVP